jgi:hypothetical protein
MRAAEHERIDRRIAREQGRKVATRDERRDVIVDPTFLGERHGQRTPRARSTVRTDRAR